MTSRPVRLAIRAEFDKMRSMGTFSWFDKWGGRGSTVATFWPLLVPSGMVGAITAWITRSTTLLQQYGALAWWSAGLLAALITAIILALAAFFNHRWAMASATRKWSKKTDAINPMDTEFIRKRIRLSDFVNPMYSRIVGKKFIDCEIVGPGSLVFLDGSNLSSNSFVQCDFVPSKRNLAMLTATGFESSTRNK